ncbi:hypothetical protein ACKF11_13905 [Methylobacillus sp. Pita2]|uniref:hypothetical protein n=1 Tax=Methylobacillus sp. Pita2 TaxID=3383245 RepID=UPI0038B5E30B
MQAEQKPTFMQSLPCDELFKPLDDFKNANILFQSKVSGAKVLVPNIWYNLPIRRYAQNLIDASKLSNNKYGTLLMEVFTERILGYLDIVESGDESNPLFETARDFISQECGALLELEDGYYLKMSHVSPIKGTFGTTVFSEDIEEIQAMLDASPHSKFEISGFDQPFTVSAYSLLMDAIKSKRNYHRYGTPYLTRQEVIVDVVDNLQDPEYLSIVCEFEIDRIARNNPKASITMVENYHRPRRMNP